ncbi:MAG: hypothetical protein LBM77_05705 [Spirochaetaceae bacterium]|jgi:hypothetical protein|nr:hypothetical protein [Spirochaetaceae bacterium]
MGRLDNNDLRRMIREVDGIIVRPTNNGSTIPGLWGHPDYYGNIHVHGTKIVVERNVRPNGTKGKTNPNPKTWTLEQYVNEVTRLDGYPTMYLEIPRTKPRGSWVIPIDEFRKYIL